MPSIYSEFGLIERIADQFAELTPEGIEGIGDDCAILPSMHKIRHQTPCRSSVISCRTCVDNCHMVITTDMLVEDVHFKRSIGARELGVRSVEVNLSDVAAMGAIPTAILLSIALPEWVDERWTSDFFDGIRSRGVALIGGDTTRSRDALCINITAIGRAAASHIKRRSAARVGHRILVAGQIGASAASAYTAAVRAQTDEGAWFGSRAEVGAMMDLSDGLAGDLPHILRASGVGAVVEIDQLPIATGATLDQALGGGEDYKLLLTARADVADRLRSDFAERFGTTLYDIGVVTRGTTLRWTQHRKPKKLSVSGFSHF